MTPQEFEALLDLAVQQLNADVLASTAYYKPDVFQLRVFDVLRDSATVNAVGFGMP